MVRRSKRSSLTVVGVVAGDRVVAGGRAWSWWSWSTGVGAAVLGPQVPPVAWLARSRLAVGAQRSRPGSRRRPGCRAGYRRLDLLARRVGGRSDDGDVGRRVDVGQLDGADVLADALVDGDVAVVGVHEVLVLGPGVRGIRAAGEDGRATRPSTAQAAQLPRFGARPSSARVTSRRRRPRRRWPRGRGCGLRGRGDRDRSGAAWLRARGARRRSGAAVGRVRWPCVRSTTSPMTMVTLSGAPALRASSTSRSAVAARVGVSARTLVDGVAAT